MESGKTELYKQVIPKECVLLIIKLYKEHFTELNGVNKRAEKRNTWAKIASVVQEHGFQMDSAQCNQKWRNMLRDYTIFIERLGQQSEDQPAGNPPWYFVQMADALNERQFLSITDADSTVQAAGDSQSNIFQEINQPFTVNPVASSMAVSGSVRQSRSRTQTSANVNESLQASCNSDSDDDLAPSRKRKRTKDEVKTEKTVSEYNLIVEAIKKSENARKEEDDARHLSLLQELRRQHFEKMDVLNKILDTLNKNSSR